jgi:hypothetical protein
LQLGLVLALGVLALVSENETDDRSALQLLQSSGNTYNLRSRSYMAMVVAIRQPALFFFDQVFLVYCENFQNFPKTLDVFLHDDSWK